MKDNTHLNSSPKVSIWNRNFICLIIAQAFFGLSQSSVNILIARYATEALGVSSVFMGTLAGLGFGVALAMRPVAGPLQMRLDKRKLLIGVYFLGVVANVGYALFNFTGAFVAFRCLQGVQYAFTGSLTMTLVADSLPKERMFTGVAVYGLGATVMQAVGPNIGTLLRDLGPKLQDGADGLMLGYKFAFFFAAAILALSVVPILMISYKEEVKTEIASTEAWYENIISIHALPMTLVLFLSAMSYSVYNNYLDAFANEVGIAKIGVFFSVSAAVMICTRPASGRIVERFGIKKVIPLGMIILISSFATVSASRVLPMALVGAFLAAFGYGMVSPSLQAACVQTEVPHRRAVSSNTIFVGMDLGNFVGPFLSGLVASASNYSMVILTAIVPVGVAIVLFFAFVPGYNRRLDAIAAMEE